MDARKNLGEIMKKNPSSKKDWIAGAVKHPGALSKKLGVPEKDNIPMSKLEKAKKSSNPTTRKQANLAITFKKIAAKRKS